MTMLQHNQRLSAGWVYGILAQALWGSGSVAISLVSSALPSPILVSIRHGIGAMLLGVDALTKRKNYVFRGLPWRHLILLGLVAGALPDLLLTTSVRHAGPIISVMLARLEVPLGVLFAHVFLKEKVTKKAYAASLVGMAGAIIVSYKPGMAIDLSNSFYFGVVMGIGAGLAWGLAAVYGKYVLSRCSNPDVVTFIRLAIGSMAALVLTILFVRNPFNALQALHIRDWLLLLYLGLFVSGLGYLLFYKSLHIIDVHVAQILMGVSMAITIILGLLIGTRVDAQQWVGILIIGYSIYLIKSNTSSDKTQGVPSEV